jgi:cell division protein FtsB
VAVAAFFLFANDGFRSLVIRTKENRRLEQALARLHADHATLSDEWTRIEKDPSYTEYLIRRNLGYVKKGEVEYRILVSSHS